jgi:hypothetical protein
MPRALHRRHRAGASKGQRNRAGGFQAQGRRPFYPRSCVNNKRCKQPRQSRKRVEADLPHEFPFLLGQSECGRELGGGRQKEEGSNAECNEVVECTHNDLTVQRWRQAPARASVTSRSAIRYAGISGLPFEGRL